MSQLAPVIIGQTRGRPSLMNQFGGCIIWPWLAASGAAARPAAAATASISFMSGETGGKEKAGRRGPRTRDQ